MGLSWDYVQVAIIESGNKARVDFLLLLMYVVIYGSDEL
jgi:hypothetical protein